jgi:hypothetical protein
VGRALTLVFVCLLGLSAGAVAQSAVDGGLAGTVVDASGARIAGARVSLSDEGSGAEASAASDATGFFQMPTVEAGDYTLQTSAAGFAAQRATVTVRVGELAVVSVRLTPATVTSSITVSADEADSASVEPGQMAVASQMTMREIEQLPINGRRWSTFALLTPGANPDESGRGLISFRGMAATLNSNLVDGGDDNQEFFAESRGRTRAAYTFTQEAVREFQVNASNYAAQYGGAAGGVVNTVTKSGARVVHGAMFYYLRDNRLGAVNPFSTETAFNATAGATTGYVKPEDVRQQFGGSISGPAFSGPMGHGGVAGGKLFYFYAFDAQSRNFPADATPQNPMFYALTANQTALMRNNRGLSTAQLDGAMSYLSALGGVVPRSGGQTVNFPKLDWVRGTQHASLQYNRMRWSSPAGAQTQAVVARGRASFGDDDTRVDSVLGRWQAQWSARVGNELRVQWSRDFEAETAQTPLAQEPATGPGGFAPQVAIGPEGFSFGTPRTLSRAAYPDERRWQISELLTAVRGRHQLKAGVEWSEAQERISNLPDAEGSYSYTPQLLLANGLGQPDGIADWITDYNFSANSYPSGGCPKVEGGALHYFCFRDFTQGFGPQTTQFSLAQWSGFVQDEWRTGAHVSVSAGVRYELEQLPAAQQPNAALDAEFAGVGSTSVIPTDRNNIAPRLGLAWAAGNKRTTLRAGYGVYYSRVMGATVRSALVNTAVLGSDGLPASAFHIRITPTTVVDCTHAACSCPPRSGGFGYPCAFTSYPVGVAAVANTTSAVMFDRRFRLPMIQEGDVAVEHEFSAHTSVTATYLMSLSRQLPNFVDANIAPSTGMATYQSVGGPFDGQTFVVPRYTARLNANYGPVTDILSNVNGSYNALVVEARRQMRRGLELRAHWTWSKALDFGQNSVAGVNESAQFDPFQVRYDKALSTLNYPQRGVASLMWSPKVALGSHWMKAATNGWELAPVWTEASGRDYSYGIRGGTSLNGGRQSINGSGGAKYLPTVGRNTLRLPAGNNMDARVARRGEVGAHVRVMMAAEVFNVLNHTNYSRVNATAYDVGQTTAGVTQLVFQSAAVNPVTPFGQYTEAGTTLTRERQVQISLRAEF